MTTTIAETKRIFLSRLDTLSHVIGIGETQFANPDAFLHKRLSPARRGKASRSRADRRLDRCSRCRACRKSRSSVRCRRHTER